ncbi:hypothetical protein CSUI_005491, partial [Cystoisospora suis]
MVTVFSFISRERPVQEMLRSPMRRSRKGKWCRGDCERGPEDTPSTKNWFFVRAYSLLCRGPAFFLPVLEAARVAKRRSAMRFLLFNVGGSLRSRVTVFREVQEPA